MEQGEKKIVKSVVGENDTALHHASGGLMVYATPAMIGLMESAAFNLLKSHGHDSVGIEISARHTRACKPGAKVEAEAEITGIDGKRVSFRITARDEKGEIGNAEHVRYIIDPEKFMAKLG